MPDPILNYTKDGIAYGESVKNWVVTAGNSGGSQATRTLFCAWSDVATLANYLLTVNSLIIGFYYFVIGDNHPIFPKFYVDSLSIKPVEETNTGESVFAGHAQIDLVYKPYQFDPGSPATIREVNWEICNEVLPLPQETIQIDPGGGGDNYPISYDDGLILSYIKYSVTLPGVQQVPLSAIQTCQGKISSVDLPVYLGNSTPVNWPADQTLYLGPGQVKEQYMSNGQKKFDFTHTFLLSYVSWNKVYDHQNTASNILDRFTLPTTTKFGSADLTTLGV